MKEYIFDYDEWIRSGEEKAIKGELVRCKDCKFFTTNKFDAEGYGNCKKDVVWRSTTTDWFCADGVK
jgi:hypothetical protein